MLIDSEWLNRHLSASPKPVGLGLMLKDNAERITCADGHSISVQASRTHYSKPRTDAGPYSHVECGFVMPPGAVEHKDAVPAEDLQPWAEEPGVGPTVYGYVPVEVVVLWINDHGGAVEAP